jgi:diguanylate cyclase (GGDEF)-like protein
VLDSGDSVFDMPIAIEWPDGTRKCLLVNGAPLRDEAGAITRIVCQVSDVTERVLIQRQMAWAARLDAAIARLSGELLAERISLDDISTQVLAHAMRLTQSLRGCVSYIDPDSDRVVSSTLTWDDLKRVDIRPATAHPDCATGLWGWVLTHRQPLLTNAAAKDMPTPLAPAESDAAAAIRRFLAVPAWLGDHLAGQIAVADSSRDYSQRDLDLLTRLASVYAMGLRRKWDEDRLVYLSTHDGLTGLYNRSYFEQQMSRLAQSGQTTVAIAVVDVDNMKAVNDSGGHAAGDELLRRAAQVLKSTFRAEDVVARIGGDEFAVLVPGARIPELTRIAARVQEQVARENAQRADMPLSFSFGIAAGRPGQSLADVLKQADANMYQDKASRKVSAAQNGSAE